MESSSTITGQRLVETITLRLCYLRAENYAKDFDAVHRPDHESQEEIPGFLISVTPINASFQKHKVLIQQAIASC